ncbi:MAG: hypothetical protein WAN43_14390 [Rhodomicrobium sp.]
MTFDFIVWLKAHYTPLFNFVKFGIAFASAYAVVRAFKGYQVRQLGPQLAGLRTEKDSLEQEAASYRRRSQKNRRLLAKIEGVNARLREETAQVALEKASEERAEGNHEHAARALATWFEAQRPRIAGAASALAQSRERRADTGEDDSERADETERLKRIASLIAPSGHDGRKAS